MNNLEKQYHLFQGHNCLNCLHCIKNSFTWYCNKKNKNENNVCNDWMKELKVVETEENKNE